MSVFGSAFRQSNLKNPLPIVFDSSVRTSGPTTNLQISLNNELTRVRKFTVSDVIIPRTYKALNEGTVLINVRAYILGNGPVSNEIALHLTPGLYTNAEIADVVSAALSRYRITATFGYDGSKFFFEINPVGDFIGIWDTGFPNAVFIDMLDYTRTSTFINTLGFTIDTFALSQTYQGRFYADTPVTWDNLLVEDRNNRVPIQTGNVISAKVPNGIYMVHDLADLLQTQLNLFLGGEYFFKFSTVKNTFFIKGDRLLEFINSGLGNDNDIFGFSDQFLSSHSIESDPVDVIDPLLNFNNLTVSIRIKKIYNITIPDLVNSTLEEARDIFQVELDKLDEDITVSISKQNNIFVLSSDQEFTILSFSVNFGLSYGLTILNVPSTFQHGTVPYYPSFNLNSVNPSNLQLLSSNQAALVSPGTYTFDSFRSVLETSLNNDMPANAPWTVDYNADMNQYTITPTAGGLLQMKRSAETCYIQIGLPVENLALLPYTSENAPIMDNNRYIYLKSKKLTSDKELSIFTSDRYTDVVGRILIESNYREYTITSKNGIDQIIFPLNVNYKDIDFRLEFENNRLVDLNGANWSVTILFGIF